MWTLIHGCLLLSCCFAVATVVWEVILSLFKSHRTPDYEGLNQAVRMRALPSKTLVDKASEDKEKTEEMPLLPIYQVAQELDKVPSRSSTGSNSSLLTRSLHYHTAKQAAAGKASSIFSGL